MRSRHRALVWSTTGLLAVPLLAVLGLAPPAAAAVAPCTGAVPAGLTRYTWDGSAGTGRWDDAANWTVDGVGDPDGKPNYYGTAASDDSTTGYVCVQPASPTTITLSDEVHVHVLALDVAGATLAVDTGSRVMVYGGPADYVSAVRAGATVRLRGSTLGGPGLLEVDGAVVWGQTGFGAATLDHDHCGDFPPGEDVAACPAAPATGLLRVRGGGALTVEGRGVNLDDGYRVEVASGGVLRVTGQGYVAADRDTAIDVAPGGLLDLAGDASVFEGDANGRPDGDLADLVNDGTVRKSQGAGRSALNAGYTGAGALDVRSGGLSVAGGTTAAVVGGARLGTGTCGGSGAAADTARPCTPVTSAVDPQLAVFTPSRPADVSLAEVPAAPGDLQGALDLEAGDASGTLDIEVRDPRPAEQLTVFRRRGGLTERIPLCSAGGALPGRVTACIVGRRLVGGATRVRIATVAADGRWSVRPSGVDFVRLLDPLVGTRAGCTVTHPAYPYVSAQPVRVRTPGTLDIRFSDTARADGTGTLVHRRSVAAGVTTVPVTVRRTGWVAAVADGESTGSFRVVATPTVRFTARSRSATAGRRLLIEGKVRPGGRRTVELWAVRLRRGTGYLAPRPVRVTTKPGGRFAIGFRPGRAGRWVVAVRVVGRDGLSTALSRQAVRVRVKAPVVRAPAPTVTAPVTASAQVPTTTEGAATDPLDVLGAFYPGRAAGCRFRVRG